jgi:hypothetical protein
LTLTGVAPLHSFAKRIAEGIIGLTAIALVILTIYLIVDGARRGELTWAKVGENWGSAYAVLFVTGVVLVLGLRLIFPSLAPGGRLLTRSGMIAFFGIYLAMALIVVFNTGVVPILPVLLVAIAIGALAIRQWFS